jgi:hypothetical protein
VTVHEWCVGDVTIIVDGRVTEEDADRSDRGRAVRSQPAAET